MSRFTEFVPVDYSPPDSSVHGILQARILEWVAMPSSKGCTRPRDLLCLQHGQAGSLTSTTSEAQ